MPAASCPTCGSRLPGNAQFCAACGMRVEGDTRILETPPHETGSMPVHFTTAEPRVFGASPPLVTLGLAAAMLVVAVVLFATGDWPIGLILLGAGLLLLVVFLEVARQRPLRGGHALGAARTRTAVALEALSVRSSAGRALLRLQRELRALDGARNARFQALGAAVYAGDEGAVVAIRDELQRLDYATAAARQQMDEVVAGMRDRIRRGRFEVQPTEMVVVPEPYPPPDEGSPPAPAPVPEPSPMPVPEPYPPPDEGTPPGPAVVPEPFPAGPDSPS